MKKRNIYSVMRRMEAAFLDTNLKPITTDREIKKISKAGDTLNSLYTTV